MSPAAVSGVYASNIISVFDIDKPERMNILFKKRGDQGLGYMLLLKSLGFTDTTAQTTFTHTEDDWIHQTFHSLNNVGAPGVGNPILITLDPQDLDANNAFYPRLWDTVMFPNEDTGQITNINLAIPGAPVLTITPNSLTANFPAVAAGDELIITSSAFSEGSGQPVGIVDRVYNYEGYTQIIKETLGATGTEMTNQKWFDVFSDGTGAKYYYLVGQENTEYRLMLKQDGALLFQQPTTNTMVDPATNRQLKTTEGLFPYIRRLGNIQAYTPGVTNLVTLFDTVSRTFDRESAGRYIGALAGINLEQQVENDLATYLHNTNVIFAQKEMAENMFGGDEGLAVSVAFNSIEKGGRIFNFRKMGIFSHAKLYGATGYSGPDYGVLMPMTKKKDKKTSKDTPSFGVRYKAFGNYNRMYEVWNQNGAGPGTKVIPEDLYNYFLRSDIGAQHMGGNQMVLLTP